MFTPDQVSVALLCAVVMFAGVLVGACWVYRDARTHTANGYPIVYSWGPIQIKTPTGWFVACALLFELFIPVYLDNRRLA